MNIALNIDDVNRFLRKKRLVWKLTIKKLSRPLIALFLLGAFFIVSSFNSNDTFWNQWTSLGMALIFLFVIGLLYCYQLRKRVLKINEQSGIAMEVTINESMITSRSVNSYVEMNWGFFQCFEQHKEGLVIMPTDSYLTAVVIFKDDIAEADFSILLEFLKKTVRERKP